MILLILNRYDFVPHNVKSDRVQVLKSYCKSVGAVFLNPESSGETAGGEPEIMQYDPAQRKIVSTSTEDMDEEGLSSLMKNHKTLTGALRLAYTIFIPFSFNNSSHNIYSHCRLHNVFYYKYCLAIFIKISIKCSIRSQF